MDLDFEYNAQLVNPDSIRIMLASGGFSRLLNPEWYSIGEVQVQAAWRL